MKELYHKYFYNKLNKVLLICTIIALLKILFGGNSIRIFDYFVVLFLPISYYITFYKNKTIEDIIPISNKEKFKRNFIVWSVLLGVYVVICFIFTFKYANGEWEIIHEWFVQQSSAILMPTVIVAGAIAKRKYEAGLISVVTLVLIIMGIACTIQIILTFAVFPFISNDVVCMITDIIRLCIIVIAIKYCFENIGEIKFS